MLASNLTYSPESAREVHRIQIPSPLAGIKVVEPASMVRQIDQYDAPSLLRSQAQRRIL